MRNIGLLFVMALSAASAPVRAQSVACGAHVRQILRGTWSMTCVGFTDLSKLDQNVPAGTLVPLSALARETIGEDGKAAGKAVFSVGGTILPLDMEATYEVYPDCTGVKNWTLRSNEPSLEIPGTASVVYLPHALEFRILITSPGDVVTCEYKKLYNAPQSSQ